MPLLAGGEKLPRGNVMDRRGQPMSEDETRELNSILASLGATKRYRPDGSKYDAPVDDQFMDSGR